MSASDPTHSEDSPLGRPGLDLAGRVPLVVAVSGHRFLEGEAGSEHRADVGCLAAIAEAILLELLIDPDHRERHGPPTAVGGLPASAWRSTPVVVLTGLAEGADRLVADVVLDLRARSPSLEQRLYLVGVLPSDLDTYLTSFTAAEDPRNSREGFLALVDRCQLAYELPAMEAPCADVLEPAPPADAAAAERRRQQEPYRRLAAYLVRNAHVLLALTSRCPELRDEGGVVLHAAERATLWTSSCVAPPVDSEVDETREPMPSPQHCREDSGLPTDPAAADGGTTTVLAWFLHGLPRAYNPGALIVDPPPTRAAFEVWWPRARPLGGAPTVPALTTAAALCKLLADFDTFNRDAGSVPGEALDQAGLLHPSHDADEARHSSERHDCLERQARDLAASRRALRPLQQCYQAADWLVSQRLRPERERTARLVLGLTLSAMLAFQLFGALVQTGLLVAYLGVLALLYCVWQRFQLARVDERRIAYRSLAEALRVQVMARHAGLELVIANEFARHSLSDLGWIRDALRGLFACAAPRPVASHATESVRLDQVRASWIRDQGGQAGAHDTTGPAIVGLGLGHIGVMRSLGMISAQDAAERRRLVRERFDLQREPDALSASRMGWFEGKARFELEPELRAWTLSMRALSALGVACAIALLCVHLASDGSAAAVGELTAPETVLSVLVVNFLALAALCSAILRVEAYQPLARHYREMAMIFRRANDAWSGAECCGCGQVGCAPADLEQRRQAVCDLAREALGDDVRWSQLLRYRPLEVSPH